MSITKKRNHPPNAEEEEEDFAINISSSLEEEEGVESGADFSSAFGGEYNNIMTASEDTFDVDSNNFDERKPASPSRGSVDNNATTTNAPADTADDDNYSPNDRKPAAAASPSRSQSRDARFLCAICIDEVSDEPVVTRCGHIFCWPCLYQWLAPGMLVHEYYAAFGGGGGIEGTSANHGGSRGNLNHFISEMATHQSNNSRHDRPYNPARWNEQRRCCPVCKAFCSVDSVIPIYIHVHAAVGSQVHQEQSQYREEEQQRSVNNGRDHDNNYSDDLPLSSQVLDPTAANMGLRQRRHTTAQTSNTSGNNALQQNSSPLCDSPEQTQRIFENIHGSMTMTPIIRNGGGDTVAVPNRPFPTPTPNVQTSSSSQHRGGQYEDQNMTTVPILNSSTIAPSSSFRLAYRPRHVDYSQTSEYRNRNMGMGGLMGIVSGLVHSIDNIGADNQQQRTSQGTTRDSEVPQIHRRDRGLGGIGRASEQDTTQSDGSGAAGVMGEEDSSLAMAREFLSRLVSR